MRNNNKELKFEFGKRCTYIRTQIMKNERHFGLVWWFGASAWFGYAHQPTLSNRTAQRPNKKQKAHAYAWAFLLQNVY